VVNYVEPFAGSLAVLLARPDEPRVETVNDVDGMLVNFWRATSADPEAVARACDWPVNEADLHARHRYLAKVKKTFAARLEADPLFFNATIAGWWVWGLSAWIGSGWCEERGANSSQRPAIHGDGKGSAIQVGVHSKAMRRQLPFVAGGSGGGPGEKHGMGTHSLAARSALYEIFEALARRLRYVRVTCGDFERILTPAVTWKHGLTGVVLDPPYEGFDNLYGTDPVSARVRAWCIENGARKDLRIALCGYDGEHNELEALGWTVEAWKAQGGYSNQSDGENENSKKERIWFSPACIKNVDATGQSAFSW
jgi:hypothetical protein